MQNKKIKLDLQLFAEGGATGASSVSGKTGSQASGENSQVAAGNTGENAQATAEERAQAYAKLKADYKPEFDSEVQGILKERLRKARDFEKEANEFKNQSKSIFDSLSVKYGIDATDIEGLAKAVSEDNSYFEEEAMRRGVDVEELRHIKQLERENAVFKEQHEQTLRQQQEQQWYEMIHSQAEETKAVYPNFDLSTEANTNEKFKSLVEKGVDVKTAYEITHKDDVIAAAMKYAANTTAQKIGSSVATNANRPSENGVSNGNAVKTTTDISKMTAEEMQAYIDRAKRGERITFKD